MERFTIWIGDTETWHNQITQTSIYEMKKYGYVLYYKDDINKEVDQDYYDKMDEIINKDIDNL